jgi:CPA2 family monovalent cation:H+ antiporter-2
VLKLGAFLFGLVTVGLLLVPRAVRGITRLGRPETTLVAALGFCFGTALLAQWFGYSVALGAFLAGSLVAESGEEKQIERLVQPVRDVFGAIFFVSVGMLIDPALIAHHWPAVAALTLAVVLGKIFSVSLGSFLAGNGTRTAIHTGMSLAQIGEFSFIIAALGVTLTATGNFLYPVAVAVSVLTTLTTPWLIRAAGPVANLVDRKLPRPLQTFATLYGSWVERLRSAPASVRPVRRMIQLLLLDAVLLGGWIITVSLGHSQVAGFIERRLGVSAGWATAGVILGAAALAVPFCAGIFAIARRLGAQLAESALPRRGDGKLDLAVVPRRALVGAFQLTIVLLVGLPMLAITQPFLSGLPGAGVLVGLLAILGVLFWRTATDLQGHVRAGTQLIAEVLEKSAPEKSNPLTEIDALLPGLGEPVSLTLEAGSPAVGQTLAQLNLRGVTGATVLAIRRADSGVVVPGPGEVLRSGDALALAGAHEATDAARVLLLGTPLAATG